MIFLFVVLMLPFIHIPPYLFFNFNEDDPLILWGLRVNEYMLNEKVIKLTASFGAICSLGFISPVIFNSSIKLKYNYNKTHVSFSMNRFLFIVILGVLLSWLSAPTQTIFGASYTESLSIFPNFKFDSAWVFSYILIIFAYHDFLLEIDEQKRKKKNKIIITALLFIVIYLQLLRGDRESLTLVVAIVVANYFSSSKSNNIGVSKKRVPKFKILIGFFMVFISSMIIGGLRSVSSDIYNISQFAILFRDLFFSGQIELSNLLHGTWSAVLLTPLSIAGDYVFNTNTYKYGMDYLNIILSLPPGFIADLINYKRPLDSALGPAWEMTYGLGGTHICVLPFRNFGILGIYFITYLWSFLCLKLDFNARDKANYYSNVLLSIIIMIAPHWLWYSEKNLINSLMIYLLVSFILKTSNKRKYII
jgi:hypothetical protein